MDLKKIGIVFVVLLMALGVFALANNGKTLEKVFWFVNGNGELESSYQITTVDSLKAKSLKINELYVRENTMIESNDSTGKIMSLKNRDYDLNYNFLVADEPPTAGYDAPIGSILIEKQLMVNPIVRVWIKTDYGDTDWTQLEFI